MVRSNILIVVLGKKKQDGSSSVSTTCSKTTQGESTAVFVDTEKTYDRM